MDNDGAYDYAANTRGYTDGAILEYDDHWFSARFGVMLMPKVANGIYLEANIAQARGENLELSATGNRLLHRSGTVRFLSYLNIANMGNYEEANANFLNGEVSTPSISSTAKQGRKKYGFELNFEQELPADLAVFGRVGWSDGRNESFAYTEDDRTVETGIFSKGDKWRRKNDRVGAVFVANQIVAAHQQYLGYGGLGFLLGDGALSPGTKKSSKDFTRCTCGADSSLPAIFSTSIIRDTTRCAVRCSFRACASTWTSDPATPCMARSPACRNTL